jgi:hypothetical protein
VNESPLEQLQRKLDGAIIELQEQRQRIRELEEQLAMRRQRESGEVWYWQSEGGNHVESISCPIVIGANALRALLDARPIKPDSDRIDFETLQRSYDFTIDWDGNVLGLVAGDNGYDRTGIRLSPETMAMFISKRHSDEDLIAWTHFYQRNVEPKIDALLDQLGFKPVHSSTWWAVVDFLHSRGHHLDAGTAQKRAMPITPRPRNATGEGS